jgi:hypothetical protein
MNSKLSYTILVLFFINSLNFVVSNADNTPVLLWHGMGNYYTEYFIYTPLFLACVYFEQGIHAATLYQWATLKN